MMDRLTRLVPWPIRTGDFELFAETFFLMVVLNSEAFLIAYLFSLMIFDFLVIYPVCGFVIMALILVLTPRAL